jgi:hypothetical protein
MKNYLLAALLLLTSCATPRAYVLTRTDSLLTAARRPSVGKFVVRGPVTIQVAGAGATQTASAADNRKAGSKQGSAATPPAAQASNASKRTGDGVPWWCWLLVAGAAGWEWLSCQVPLGWLRWRAR